MSGRGQHERVLFFYEGVSYRLQASEEVGAWLLHVAACEGVEVGALRVVLCADTYVQGLHAQYLADDSPTDILTFDYREKAEQALEGELYVGMGCVRRHARRYGVDFEAELFRVLVHGLLHLCGYRDDTKAAQVLMRKQEDACLVVMAEKRGWGVAHVPCET